MDNYTQLGHCDLLCKKFGLKLTCCGSCHHDDEELGMELCMVKYEGQNYFVCCKIAEAVDNITGNSL